MLRLIPRGGEPTTMSRDNLARCIEPEPYELPLIARVTAPFEMRRGGVLPGYEIAYETWGTLDADAGNAVLILTGLSPSAHARSSHESPEPGWWEKMIGPGAPLDTRRDFIICVNHFGSCFGSTGPASIDPRTGRRYGLRFPELTMEDMARAVREALRTLGIRRLRALVAPSMGGMVALAYAVQFPDEIGSLLLISTAGRVDARTIAIHSLQREAIRIDPAWQGGDYDPHSPPVAGMKLARKIGMSSYRTAEEWAGRFGRHLSEHPPTEPFGIEFEIESYLEAVARKFVSQFDANSYLYLSRAMDLFDVAEHGHNLHDAIARIGAERVLIIGVESDTLFPVERQRVLADAFGRAGKNVDLRILPSLQGHDAFLVDMARFKPLIGDFLAGA